MFIKDIHFLSPSEDVCNLDEGRGASLRKLGRVFMLMRLHARHRQNQETDRTERYHYRTSNPLSFI